MLSKKIILTYIAITLVGLEVEAQGGGGGGARPTLKPTPSPLGSNSRPTSKSTLTPTKMPMKPTPKPTRLPLKPTSKPTLTPTRLPTSFSCPVGKKVAITNAVVNTMITAVAGFICSEGFGTYRAASNNCGQNADSQAMAAVIGGVLRLSFHDSVTYNTDGTGGPDGCLNFDDPDNGGLKSIVYSKANSATLYTLDSLYSQFSAVSSRADFWAVAANVAVMLGGGPDIAQRSGASCTTTPCVSVRWGRVDAASCTSDSGRFPSSLLAHAHILDVFKTRLGFTEREIVALMGAHSVGRSTLSESHIGFTTAENALQPTPAGLSGRWDNSPDQFDNAYFGAITNVPWNTKTHNTLEDGTTTFSSATFQWSDRGQHAQLMLNTDMALVWDVSTVTLTSVTSGRGACARNLGGNGALDFNQGCSKNSVFSTDALDFAGSQANWFAVWVSAWAKMQELGWSNGKKGPLFTISNAVCG